MQGRMRQAAMAAATVLAIAVAGCSAAGSGSDSAPTSVSVDRSVATTKPPFSPTTTRPPVASDPDAPRPWADVVAAAGTPYGTVTRSVNAIDPATGDGLVPDMDIQIRFDTPRGLAAASADLSAVVDGAGRVDLVWDGSRTLVTGDLAHERCGVDAVPLDDAVGLADLAVELGAGAGLPFPPFDRIVEGDPVVGVEQDGASVYEVDIRASLLVASGAGADPVIQRNASQMKVPAQVTLRSDGSLEVDGRVPIRDVMPADELAQIPAGMEDMEMVGSWFLEPLAAPPKIEVPTDVALSDDCLDR